MREALSTGNESRGRKFRTKTGHVMCDVIFKRVFLCFQTIEMVPNYRVRDALSKGKSNMKCNMMKATKCATIVQY